MHHRRTGVTSHIETVVPRIQFDAAVIGQSISETTPKMTWRDVLEYAKTNKPMVWHSHRNNETATGLWLRTRFPNVKVVRTWHNAGVPARLTRGLMSSADAVVSLTQNGADTCGVPSRIIGHGIDVERFKRTEDKISIKRRLGIQCSFTVAVVGRIRPNKGQGDFTKSITPLLEDRPDLSPIVIGAALGKHKRWLNKLTIMTGGRLKHVEQVDDIRPWLQGVDVVVMPSHSEGFSLVVLEAMAAGVPVVASNLPHMSEIISDGKNGYLYPTGDSIALSKIIARLHSEPKLTSAIGAQGALSVRQNGHVNKEVQALNRLYMDLIGAVTTSRPQYSPAGHQ
jgi:mannosyltransferase